MKYAQWIAILSVILFAFSWMGCQSDDNKAQKEAKELKETVERPDTGALEMVDIADLDSSIVLDLRYATSDNFVEVVLYDCPRCMLRREVAEAVVEIHQKLREEGLGLKLFDCYRPLSVQKRLFSIVPDTHYVADPAKGSNHNRGIAVDATLVDEEGKQLNMGTRFDHFGLQAHHDFPQLPDSVLLNRRKLKQVMISGDFKPLATEWWHYAYTSLQASVEEEMWDCPE